MVIAEKDGKLQSLVFDLEENLWKHVLLEDFDDVFVKSFMVDIYGQIHLFRVASNYTKSYLFRLENQAWIEIFQPIVDHEFLLQSEQFYIFNL